MEKSHAGRGKATQPESPCLFAKTLPLGKAIGLLSCLVAASWGVSLDAPHAFLNELGQFKGVLTTPGGPKEGLRYGTRLEALGNSLLPEIGWGIRKIGADSVWAVGTRGSGVVVAVLGTGVRYTHVDLADHLWTNADEIPGNGIDDDLNGYVDDYLGFDFVNDDGDPRDDHGHGTFVAGLVLGDGSAGFCSGVAPEATLMSIKVLDSLGIGDPSDIWSAIEYAVDNGADIISLVFGWTDPEPHRWRAYLKIVAEAGRILVATVVPSTRNPPYLVAIPGSVPPPWLHPDQTLRGEPAGVISVGATDSFDVYDGPQIGPAVWPDFPYIPGDPDSIGLIKPDVSAPGVDIISLDFGSDTTYLGGSGWSGHGFGAAHVVGVAALLRSAQPSLSPAETDSILEITAVELGVLGKDNFYGAGRVDAWAAYNCCVPGVDEGHHENVPDHLVKLARLECSPNPFFGSIALAYVVENQEPVTIRIWDLGGRMRKETRIAKPTSSRGSIHWDGRDGQGHGLPSGIYFVRLSAGSLMITEKIVLMN